MTGCCAKEECGKQVAVKLVCPSCAEVSHQVGLQTVLHHLLRPWQSLLEPTAPAFYFCANKNCEIVYFSEGQQQYSAKEVVKLTAEDGQNLLCYCFQVSEQDYLQQPELVNFVKAQTKLKRCACEVKNPSGKCCLKDFKVFDKQNNHSAKA